MLTKHLHLAPHMLITVPCRSKGLRGSNAGEIMGFRYVSNYCSLMVIYLLSLTFKMEKVSLCKEDISYISYMNSRISYKDLLEGRKGGQD